MRLYDSVFVRMSLTLPTLAFPVPACATSHALNAEQIHPTPETDLKSMESIEMNGQPSAGWAELNGNVKLATDLFCLSVQGPCPTGEPKPNNTQLVTVNSSLFPSLFSSMCRETVRELMGRDTIGRARKWIKVDVHCGGYVKGLH